VYAYLLLNKTGDCTLGDYEFTMNDHGLKASVEKSNCEKPKMIIPGTGKVYEVLQFHIHTGCENKFNNTGCDAELHLVHIAKTDIALPAATTSADLPDLAVLGLMMYGVDEKHASVDALIDSWSEVSCSNQKCMTVSDELKSQKFSPYSLIPSGTSIYNFQGSLTTPPCWEVVTWNVAEKPIKMSFKQVLAITNLINKYSGYRAEDGSCVADSTVADDAGITSRDVQPLNGRQIVKNCEPLTVMSDFPAAAQEQSPMTASSESSAQILSIKNIFGVVSVLASIVLF